MAKGKSGKPERARAKPRSAGGKRAGRVRKEFWLAPDQLDEARRLLGTVTDVDTVEAALDLVVFRDEVRKGVRSLRGARLTRID